MFLGRLKVLLRLNKDVWDYLENGIGIIHVGANEGQEAAFYAAKNMHVLWIEALPEAYIKLSDNITKYNNQKAINALIHEKSGLAVDFMCDGVMSSIYEYSDYAQLWGMSNERKKITLITKTLDEIMVNEAANLYDTLVLDVQGAELAVLKGACNTLKKINRVIAEARTFSFYEDECKLRDIDKYLKERGFRIKYKKAIRWIPGVGTEYNCIWIRV